MKIHILRKGQTYGPYDRESIEGFLKEGLVSGGDLAWTLGQEGWIPLGELLGLTSEPTVEQDLEGEQTEEQSDPELAETVAKIENLLDKEEEQLALDLVVGLNDPKVYEAFLNECRVVKDQAPYLWFPPQYDTSFILNLIGLCPDHANVDPYLGIENLSVLDLREKSLEDLSPLSKLQGLETLALWGNYVSDLSPLSSLCKLRRLDLGKNRVRDLSPLDKLENLEELYLRYNQVKDLAPLASLENLKWLWLGGNQVADLSPLAGLKKLNWLKLENNPASDFSPLAELPNLKRLTLEPEKLSDMELANLEDALPECRIEN